MGAGGAWGGFGLLATLLVLVILLALLVLVAYLLVRTTREGAAAGDPEDAALSTLRERFARGEMDPEEYETRRSTLVD
jgi:putative membrane protein